ncbi:MAG: ATP-binding cassette transporter snq2 [Geoglossum umbratile]|nr:MAG: ATP-binding cassette transporter snq2 [Geoglossum umbratile]
MAAPTGEKGGYPPRLRTNTDTTTTDSERPTLESHLRDVLQRGPAQGLPPLSSSTSVLFKGLRVQGSGAGATYLQDVGKAALMPAKLVRRLLSHGREPQRTILHGIDGVVKAGDMLLVLGRPGSGCSTMLKSLAGFTKGFVGWEGVVKYNGVGIEVLRERFRGDIVYNSEGKQTSNRSTALVDEHFPHLNVEHTLKFAVETRTPHMRIDGISRPTFVERMADVLLNTLGLQHTLKTKVGNAYVHGISGGERKRVSLAETLATHSSVGYWDNPTRGLDASTSLEFIRVLRNNTRLARSTAIVALYQAGENLTIEFDHVTVLYLGRQIFFGTLSDAESHFADLGFLRKERQTIADFLTGITDPAGRRAKEGWEGRVPRGPDDFAKAWKESRYFAALQEEIKRYEEEFGDGGPQLEEYGRLQMAQKSQRQRQGSPYTINLRMQMRATLRRAWHRMRGDKVYLGATAFSAVFMSLIMGSVFVNTTHSTSGFFSKGGVIFFSVLFNALQNLAEIGMLYSQRPVVQKQKGYAMYHPFTDSLSSMFVDWPFKLLKIAAFDVIVYFMAGLKKEAGAFFIFLLVTYITSLAVSGLFRTIGAATKKVEVAMGMAGVSILAMAIYAGYIIPVPSMHPWFRWINYINPVSYAFEALMANEFHAVGAPCSFLIPSGPGYQNAVISQQVCPVTGANPGQMFVKGDDYLAASFEYYHSHLWRDIGILLAFIGFFVTTYALATEYISPAPGKGEFLIFRQGHEPESVRRALQAGEVVDDLESGASNQPLTGTTTEVSEVRGLVKSEDTFTWENISYDIPLSDGTSRRLLSNVTGYVKPGTLTALMGESGAGKTTLLNVLADRINIGTIYGSPLVNGQPPGRSFQRRTGYVQQQDLHLAESTVREALRFSARLRQPQEVPLKEKYEYVEKVIEMLEMEDYAEAVIGSPGNGLNVEQRKRTTIGVELVAKPALLLFLDEPTSGLDSQSAYTIIKFLRKLADSGQAILCTIHQPSSLLFSQFDRLLLLQMGGKTAYFGPVGNNSHDILDYFARNGAVPCPEDANPAEYILDVIGAGAGGQVERDWHEVWVGQEGEVVDEIKELVASGGREVAGGEGEEVTGGGDFAASWFEQYRVVQVRVFRHYWRSPSYIISKIFLNVMAGLFLGFTFYKEPNSVQGLQNKLFAVFMAVILAMPLMNQLQPRWAALSALYLIREKPSKMFHWSAFVLSNIIAEIPYNMFAGTLFFFPWFFAVGTWHDYHLDRAQRGAYTWLIFMLFQMWWSTFGQSIAALAPNEQTAAVLTTLFAAFVIMFNGVLQPISALVGFWHWMYYLSPFTWLVSGLLSTTLHDVAITCAPKEISIFMPPQGQTCGDYAGAFVKRMHGKILNPMATSNCEYCRFSTGDQYLSTLNMRWEDRWRDFGLLAVYILFNAMMAFVYYYLAKIRGLHSLKIAREDAPQNGGSQESSKKEG